MGQAPTSQSRPRDTDHLRPSNLVARTLSLVERTLSKFGGDPCPVRPGLAAAVKCYVRKKRFPCVGSEQNDPALPTALLTCFGVMKGNTVLFSVFWNDDCWPKKRPCQFLFHDSQNPWCKVTKPKYFPFAPGTKSSLPGYLTPDVPPMPRLEETKARRPHNVLCQRASQDRFRER